MKQFIFGMCFLIIFPSSILSNFLTITDSNFKSLSKNTPVLAMFSLSCDMGGYAEGMFAREFEDIKGIQLGAININTSKTLYSAVYSLYQKTNTKLGDKGITLGTIVLINNGEVVHTTQMDYPNKPNSQYSGGLEAKRRWIEFALNKNNIPYQMKYSAQKFDRVKPLALNGNDDLNQGKIAYFDFKDIKDRLNNQKDFILRGNANLVSGTLFSDGKYDSNRTTAYFLYKNKTDEPYSKEFSLSLNFKTRSVKSDILFNLGYKLLKVGVVEGKLNIYIDPSYQRGTTGAIGSWHYILEETNIPTNQWQNIIISLDANRRRVMIRLNGKRLNDIHISDRLADELKIYKPGANFYGDSLGIEFSDYSRGDVLNGFVDDLIIYNRLLNDAEQLKLYQSIKPEGLQDIEEPKPANLELENWKLLKASNSGNINSAKEAIESGADINFENNKWTALMYASYYGYQNIVELLIDNKANVLVHADGWNAQKLAEAQGHIQIVKLLEDYSNSREFYFERGFPLIKHRSIKTPAEINNKGK
jgi:hypothetical protein